MSLPAEYFDPATGRLLTLHERRQRDNQAEHRASDIRKLVHQQAQKPVDYTTRRINSNESYRADLERELAFGPTRDRRAQIERRLHMLAEDTGTLREQQATEAKQLAFTSHTSMQLAIKHCESFVRTPPVGADPDAVATAAAMLTAGFDDPEECARQYWSHVRAVEDAAHHRADNEAAAKAAAVHKAEGEAARARVAAIEAQRRAEQAAELAGGDTE